MRKDFRQIKSFQITNRLQRRIEASIADAAPVVVHCPISVSAADTGTAGRVALAHRRGNIISAASEMRVSIGMVFIAGVSNDL